PASSVQLPTGCFRRPQPQVFPIPVHPTGLPRALHYIRAFQACRGGAFPTSAGRTHLHPFPLHRGRDMPSAGLNASQLAELAKYDTPTVCNVVELFELRPRNAGYMNDTIK